MEVKMITDTLIKADEDRFNQRPLAAQMRKQYNAFATDIDVYAGIVWHFITSDFTFYHSSGNCIYSMMLSAHVNRVDVVKIFW